MIKVATRLRKRAKKVGNGCFSHAILKGLEGDMLADFTKDGQVEINELFVFMKATVKKLSHNQQTPNLALPARLDDFPFYLKAQ